MNQLAAVLWSVAVAVGISYAAWQHLARQRRIQSADPGVADLARAASLAIESLAERLHITPYEHDAAKRALGLLVARARLGDPEALLALPGVVALIERAASAAEARDLEPARVIEIKGRHPHGRVTS